MWVIISGFGTQAQEVTVYDTIPQAKTQLRGVEDARSIVGTKKMLRFVALISVGICNQICSLLQRVLW
jgi:hypothetical protein